tara:strand:+ start:725 stop:1042 length:318 start_codon:yes stop_codon:yes gene_type:complete
MIIYSITTAIETAIDEKWVEFMQKTHIPSIMNTGLFVDFRFVRIIPSQGVDLSYNLQLRCKGYAELNRFRSENEPKIDSLIKQNFEGKYATFQSVLDQVSEGEVS